jgi:hypothetical protein
MMPMWRPVSVVNKTVTNSLGDGLNLGVPPFDIKESELTYVSNMDSHEYPAITTRYDRTNFSTALSALSAPNGIGERANTYLHVVDGKNWQYWNPTSTALATLSTSLTATAQAEIMDFNTGSVRYTILMNSTQAKYWTSTGSTALNLGDASMPYTNIFTVHKGRIYAAKGATVYYCALNSVNDWTTSNDAGNITIARAKGDITGICEYNDKVIAFTEYSMHELYGSSPSNFELIDVEGNIGCVSNRSIIKANKKLYWAWVDGIYEYNGGTPLKISQPVNTYIKGILYSRLNLIAAGSNGDFIYFAIPYANTTNNMLLMYDTRIGKWYTETGSFKDFTLIGNSLYGLTLGGEVVNMRNTNTGKDNSTSISWSFITKPYITGSGNTAETLWDISVLYKGSSDATMNVYYSTHASNNDSTSFNSIAVSSDFDLDNSEHVERLLIPSTVLQNEPFFRLKFDGTDDVTVYRIERTFRTKRR